jgi:tRNA threonylcarbamoyladenosine modification (KEOPS) complex Cgi121 subunit
MNYKNIHLQKTLILFFATCIAIQAWRGLFLNTWNIAKSFIQLSDIRKSQTKISFENNIMIEKVRELRKAPLKATLAAASRELNLVKDPKKEIVIKFSGTN